MHKQHPADAVAQAAGSAAVPAEYRTASGVVPMFVRRTIQEDKKRKRESGEGRELPKPTSASWRLQYERGRAPPPSEYMPWQVPGPQLPATPYDAQQRYEEVHYSAISPQHPLESNTRGAQVASRPRSRIAVPRSSHAAGQAKADVGDNQEKGKQEDRDTADIDHIDWKSFLEASS